MVNPSVAAAAPSQEPIVVVLATKTIEKIQHLNTAAREQGYPIHFVGLNEVRDAFRSAPEDTGDSEANAFQKCEYTEHAFSDCQKEGPYRNALKGVIKGLGVDFNPDCVLFASEDSTLHIPEDVWKKLKAHLRALVPEKLLASAEGEDGKYAGFGAETGPLLAAVGIRRMMHMLYDAAQECGYGDGPVFLTDRVDFIFRSLTANAAAPMKHLKIETGLCLTREGLAAGDAINPEKEIVLTTHYLSHAYQPSVTAATDYQRYIAHMSPRAGTIRAIAKEFGLEAQKVECVCEPPKVDHPVRKSRSWREAAIDVTLPKIDPNAKSFGDRLYSYLDISPRLFDADAFIFKPFDAENLPLKRRAYYELAATIVAKQTEAEHMNKAIIVLDDGCWKDFRMLEMMLSNLGMVKNFRNHPFFSPIMPRPVLPTGINHIPTAYVDYVTAEKGRSFDRAMREVADYRAAAYRRYTSPGDLADSVEYVAGFEDMQIPAYGVACYLSAGNDNKILLNRNYKLGSFVSQQGFASVSGGGDDHAMGAYYWGSKAGNGGFVVLYSTPSIIKSETKQGRLPEANIWGLCQNTSERRVQFKLSSQSHVVSWGGIGTFEEQASFATCYDAFEEFRDRQLILDAKSIHRDPSMMNPLAYPAVAMLYGSKAAERSRRDHDALFKEHGVLIATEPEEIQSRILQHAAQFPTEPRKIGWRAPVAMVV